MKIQVPGTRGLPLLELWVGGEKGVGMVTTSVAGGSQTGCDLKTAGAYFALLAQGILTFVVVVTDLLESLMKAVDLLLRQMYKCTNKQNFKYTFTGARGSLELTHRFRSRVLIADKTPCFRPRHWNICLLSHCLGGFRVPIFSSRNLFFN